MTEPLVAEFATDEEFLAAYDAEVTAGGLLVRGATLPPGVGPSNCTLRVRIARRDVAELPATIASAAPGVGVTVLFLSEPVALIDLAERLRASPVQQEPSFPDLDRLSVSDRIKLAQSSGREVRMRLLRQPNKLLHAHVLKNPRVTIEEVQWAARLPTLSPDALKMIAEHPEWGHNVSVAAALVRNPMFPIPLALRLLSRVPQSELRAIAKGSGRPAIVQAARKMVIG